MYRSLSDRGSLTEYVCVLLVTDSSSQFDISCHFNVLDLLSLGHRICLRPRRGTRFPLRSMEVTVYSSRRSRNRMGLGR
jgi:hypothetical protein